MGGSRIIEDIEKMIIRSAIERRVEGESSGGTGHVEMGVWETGYGQAEKLDLKNRLR